MTLPFALHVGLPSGQEGAAAELYWQAFGPKLNRLLGPEARALRMLASMPVKVRRISSASICRSPYSVCV